MAVSPANVCVATLATVTPVITYTIHAARSDRTIAIKTPIAQRHRQRTRVRAMMGMSATASNASVSESVQLLINSFILIVSAYNS